MVFANRHPKRRSDIADEINGIDAVFVGDGPAESPSKARGIGIDISALKTRVKMVASTQGGRIGIILAFVVVTLVLVLCKDFIATTTPPDLIRFTPFKPKYDDIYAATPFCRPYGNGTCGEEADVPTPRTVYSAKSQNQYDDWWAYHAVLNASAAEYAHRMAKLDTMDPTAVVKRPFIFLGDSITESFMGTELGLPNDKWNDIPQVFESAYANYDNLVLGVSGDQTQHLLWRLQNGNLLKEFADDEEALFYMLIGTNNLGAGHLPQDAIKGILAVVNHLMTNIKGLLVVLDLLPRGDSFRLERLCPPRCDHEKHPFKSFMPAVNIVNAALKEQIPLLSRKQYDGRIRLIDCAKVFAPDTETWTKGEEVNVALMPDRLHPNAKGHDKLAKCVLDCIAKGKC